MKDSKGGGGGTLSTSVIVFVRFINSYNFSYNIGVNAIGCCVCFAGIRFHHLHSFSF